jgi:curved DNA-binding protein CbpA
MPDMPKSTAMLERQPDLTSGDPYRVLGVLPTATQADIKQAYFTLIRQYPPESEGENFKLIRAAYEKIKSAQRRVETDIFLPQPPPAWQPPPATLTLDTTFHPNDVLLALRRWGELGRANFEADFREIDL